MFEKIGLEVTYIPRRNKDYKFRELGKVTSWNDLYVFVNYGSGNSKATSRQDLKIGDQTFYCPDEYNSVMDGAFGRCQHICNNCQKIRDFKEINL
jgi:hypothetical protein